MIDTFEKTYNILSTQIDHRAQLGMVQILGLNQDNFCEFFKLLGCDGITMIPVANCFFVATKTRFKILSSPRWLDDVRVISSISKKSVARIECDCTIVDESGNVCAYGKQELCAMDSNTRRLRMVDTTLFPRDISIGEPNDITFDKLDFDNCDSVTQVTVQYSNTDFFGHTNNVEYVKMMLDVLPVDLVRSIEITDFEIHYIKESKAQDVLDIKYRIGDDSVLFEIYRDDAIITKAKMIYKVE